jgi:hypothetical protein
MVGLGYMGRNVFINYLTSSEIFAMIILYYYVELQSSYISPKRDNKTRWSGPNPTVQRTTGCRLPAAFGIFITAPMHCMGCSNHGDELFVSQWRLNEDCHFKGEISGFHGDESGCILGCCVV